MTEYYRISDLIPKILDELEANLSDKDKKRIREIKKEIEDEKKADLLITLSATIEMESVPLIYSKELVESIISLQYDPTPKDVIYMRSSDCYNLPVGKDDWRILYILIEEYSCPTVIILGIVNGSEFALN